MGLALHPHTPKPLTPQMPEAGVVAHFLKLYRGGKVKFVHIADQLAFHGGVLLDADTVFVDLATDGQAQRESLALEDLPVVSG